MEKVIRQSLYTVQSNTHYLACAFYLESTILDLSDCIFNNCSFRTNKIHIKFASNCTFQNCTFDELVINTPVQLEFIDGSICKLNFDRLELRDHNLLFMKVRYISELSLYRCGLNKIPKQIFKMKTLTKLNLGNNNIQKLPQELYLLNNLTFLDLANNDLKEIPPQIASFSKLKVLCLDKNPLYLFPYDIVNLPIEDLYLSECQISALPKNIYQMKKLKSLWLNKNAITSLPQSITQLANLKYLYIEENPGFVISEHLLSSNIQIVNKI